MSEFLLNPVQRVRQFLPHFRVGLRNGVSFLRLPLGIVKLVEVLVLDGRVEEEDNQSIAF